MKDSILKRAREGAAIIISSHLLHLVQEICSHILILKNGRKISVGTMQEIARHFADADWRCQPGGGLSSAPRRAGSLPLVSMGSIPPPRHDWCLLFLQYHSVKIAPLMRFKRLKKPKYLVGAIVGALYFYFYFFDTCSACPPNAASDWRHACSHPGQPGAF